MDSYKTICTFQYGAKASQIIRLENPPTPCKTSECANREGVRSIQTKRKGTADSTKSEGQGIVVERRGVDGAQEASTTARADEGRNDEATSRVRFS